MALALLLGTIVVVRATLVVPVRVDSASMDPTYAEGDVVLVSRHPPELDDLTRGDLVVFRSPEDGARTIKRVVGLGGEVVVVLDGVLYVDDEPVTEPYVDPDTVAGYYSATFSVPEGSVFVLGDNRGNSVDSRDYGPVAASDLLGRSLMRLWPLTG
ncbi:signal peptidase I [Nocardioides sp. P5_C9_2]